MKTKDRSRNQPPLTPLYPRRGITRLPSSDEEGLGVVGSWLESAYTASSKGNKARMSMKTNDKVKKPGNLAGEKPGRRGNYAV
jgi:hypothetical protein